MVSRWKRLFYSLSGTAAGAFLLATCLMFAPGKSESPLKTFVGTASILFAVSLSGWILALPLVLLVRNIDSWRFWMYLGIGTMIGPLVTYIGAIQRLLGSYHGAYNQAPAVLVALGMASVISFSASLCYLLLFRKAQGRFKRNEIIAIGS
ncbi:MAG: hypothetical protein KGN79_12125 [Acidobacteriota bacterium]|nr:hypothetical protein [Acidobacteriota bacterium]